MPLPGRSGASSVRGIIAVLAALGCASIAVGPGPALAQGTEMDKVQEQRRQACILMNGDPECMWHHGSGPVRPAPPPKPDVWGAIAVSSTLSWGVSWNAKTREDAERTAIEHCKASAGQNPCTIKVTVADVCLSLVTSTKEHVVSIGGPTGATDVAEGAAMLRCQRAGGHSCKIVKSFCADGGGRHDLKGHTTFSIGNPIYTPGNASSRAPAGRR